MAPSDPVFPSSEPRERRLTLWTYFWSALSEKYASFEGRARRLEYWSYYLILALFYLIILLAQGLVEGIGETIHALLTPFGIEGILSGAGDRPYLDAPVLVWVLRLLSLVLMVPTLAVSCRRYHDVGLPAWSFWIIRSVILTWASIIALRYGAREMGETLFHFLAAIAGVMMLVDLAVHLWPGTRGSNTYGPDPRIPQLPPPGEDQ